MYYKGKKLKGKAGPNLDLHGYGEQIRKLLASRIPLGKDIRALDVGTGFGGMAEFLATSVSKKSRVWTLDPSKEVIADVTKDMKSKGLADRIEFVVGSADEMDFEGGFFDAVVSVMALHHMKDLKLAVQEMFRVLKSEGTILLVDYLPDASHKLEFRTAHHEHDFFTPDVVKSAMQSAGAKAQAEAFDLWYLVEGKR